LGRPAREISLLQVVEALEGPIKLNRCLIQPDNCPREGFCPVHRVWAQAQYQLSALLASTTFDKLTGSDSPRPMSSSLPIP